LISLSLDKENIGLISTGWVWVYWWIEGTGGLDQAEENLTTLPGKTEKWQEEV